MADCPSYDCAEWTVYEYSGCSTYLGGGRHLVLLKCGTTITDPTSGSEINAAITAGNAVLIKDVLVGIPAGSPVKVDSLVAGVPQIVATYDRTASLVDRKVSNENVDFYNSVNSSNGLTLGGFLLYESETDRTTYVDSAVTIEGGRIVPTGDTELQNFAFTLNWRSKTDGSIYTAATGVWD